MILGAGYSSCSTVVASLTGLDYWKIPQISYASTSPELSNKAFYPNFYRTIPADTSFNAPRIAILKEFNWSHAAIIYQEEDIHRAAVEHLQEEFLKNNIHRITSEGFRDSPATQMATLKKRDARIIFGNFFGSGARKVFCEAYKLGMYGSRYQWIILGYIEKNWWLPQGAYSDCTAEEVLKAANSLLMTDYLWHATDDMFTVSGKTVKRFFEEYDNKVPAALRDEHAGYAYDAVWTMALALNRSIARNPGLRLDLLPYGDNSTNHVMIQELALMNFTGVTGPVAFTSTGDRIGDTNIFQLIDGKKVPVALYQSYLGTINWTGYNTIIWPGGSPPSDRIRRAYQLQSVSVVLFVFMSVISLACICASLFFLWFNTKYKAIRFIKMSSPNLNNAMIFGCVLNYVSVLLFGLDGGLLTRGHDIACASRTWMLSLGFSLAYGSMFSKTWRVHTIFTNRKLRRKVVKDRHLFIIVMAIVFVDVVYLSVWQILDPLTSVLRQSTTQDLEDVVVVVQVRHCESADTYRWLGVLCGYKGLLLLFGAFLAWETRRVTIAALNDSKYIGMSVYNVFVLCVIGVPMSLVMRDHPDACYAIVAISIIFCTSITLCLVFIPKVIEMRRMMAVGGQPENVFTSNSLARANLQETMNTMGTIDELNRQLADFKAKLSKSETEVETLRQRLRHYEEGPSASIASTSETTGEDSVATAIAETCGQNSEQNAEELNNTERRSTRGT
ncbi:gamma-aminobutyric acid type B receptor subunit 2-like isoform X2 [Nematostella vectensis]|nr:gamma-aminobutyric acid type B receptor subunit 2-like isoform X2 [Nematostella vectensis]